MDNTMNNVKRTLNKITNSLVEDVGSLGGLQKSILLGLYMGMYDNAEQFIRSNPETAIGMAKSLGPDKFVELMEMYNGKEDRVKGRGFGDETFGERFRRARDGKSAGNSN